MNKNGFRLGYGNYFKSEILKINWYQLFSKFSTITRWNIDSSIWKTPYSWRFHRHGSTDMLILSSINIMKRKWAKMSWKLFLLHKNPNLFFEENLLDISLIVTIFLPERNLVFKLNLLWSNNFYQNLFIVLPYRWYSVHILEFIHWLWAFFIRTSKILMGLNTFHYFFIFNETFVPINGKNYSWS